LLYCAVELVQYGFMEAFADAVGLRAFGFGARVRLNADAINS
jgi:hypothetical protein